MPRFNYTFYLLSQNGEIKCKKNCTPEHELPCKHPQKHNGDCCKQCPDSKTKDGKRNRKDRRRKNKGKGNKRRRHRKDCKDKANKSERFEQTLCAFSVTSPECSHQACLKGVLAIRRIFLMITKPKFSNCSNVFKIGLFR